VKGAIVYRFTKRTDPWRLLKSEAQHFASTVQVFRRREEHIC
jgi:hypothetical protein